MGSGRTVQYHVADIVLDSASRLVSGPQGPLPVPRRVFDCLVYLIEHRERAVARDELILYVWKRSNVSDTQLAQTVLRARRLLHDDGSEQRLIRTVPGFGYHWIGMVPCAEGGAPDAAAALPAISAAATAEDIAAAVPADEPPLFLTMTGAAPSLDARQELRASALPLVSPLAPRQRSGRWLAAGVAIAAAVTILLLEFAATYLPASVAAAAPVPRRVVILPVEMDPAAAADVAWARLGLMDLLASRLRAQGIVVPPSESVLAALAALPPPPPGTALRPQMLQADLLLQPRLSRLPSGWEFSLEGRRANGADLRLQHQHPQVLQAAALVGDTLLANLGQTQAGKNDSSGETALRVRAALLGNELETIRSWLAALPPAQRSDRETRYLAAELDYRAGRLGESRAALDDLLQDAELAADAAFRGRVLAARGSIAMRQRDDIASERDFAAAIVALAGSGGRDLGRALMGRGGIALRQQRLADAQADLSRARVLLDAAGDDLGVARAEVNLALLDRRQGRPLEALDQLQSAATRFGNYAAVNELSATLGSIVDLQCGLLRWDDALVSSDRAQRLLPQLIDRLLRTRVLQARAEVLLGLGRLAEAGAALEIVAREDTADDADAAARSELLAAELALARGERTAATRARSVLMRDGAPRDLRLRAAQVLQAVQLPLPQFAMPTAENGAAEDVDGWLLRGLAHQSRQAVAEAESSLREGLQRATALRDLREQRQAALALAGLLSAQGRSGEVLSLAAPLAMQVSRDYDTALLFVRLHREQSDAEKWRSALHKAAALAGERRVPEALSLPWQREGENMQGPQVARAALR